MVGIKYSNTHINTKTHSNSLVPKHLLVALKPPTSITNPCIRWLEGSSPGRSSAYHSVSQRCDLVLHSISYFRYFSDEDIGSTNSHMYCRDCKMQAGLYRLHSSSQRNTLSSPCLLMLLFNKRYLINYIICVMLPGFPPSPPSFF